MLMTRSNEPGIPIWLSTSRFAPPSEMLRTKQSIPEPPNRIVPAFMTFWRWSRLLFITTAQMHPLKFLQIDHRRYDCGYGASKSFDCQATPLRRRRAIRRSRHRALECATPFGVLQGASHTHPTLFD